MSENVCLNTQSTGELVAEQDSAPFFFWHHVNGWEHRAPDSDTITLNLDVVAYPDEKTVDSM